MGAIAQIAMHKLNCVYDLKESALKSTYLSADAFQNYKFTFEYAKKKLDNGKSLLFVSTISFNPKSDTMATLIIYLYCNHL